MDNHNNQQVNNQEEDKPLKLFEISNDELEKWVKEKLYPAMKKLANRGITPEL